MLGSRKLYRLVRIVLGILTILSMLGISVKIFADELTYDVILNTVGSGVVSGSGSYNSGSNVEIIATPNENYAFVGWFNDSELLDLYSYESSTTINNISSNITLYAQFIEINSSEPEDPNPEQPIVDNNSFKYLSAILIVVCMIYWNDVLKEYL